MKPSAIVLAILTLAGCTSPEEQARQDYAYCREAEKLFARNVDDRALAGREFFMRCWVDRMGGRK